MARYAWPGNVRQLRGMLRQLAVASRGEPTLRADPTIERSLASAASSGVAALDDVTPEALRAALEAHQWSFGKAARALGLTRASAYRMAESDPEIRTGADLDRAALHEARRTHGGDLDAMAMALRVSKRSLKLRMTALGIAADGS